MRKNTRGAVALPLMITGAAVILLAGTFIGARTFIPGFDTFLGIGENSRVSPVQTVVEEEPSRRSAELVLKPGTLWSGASSDLFGGLLASGDFTEKRVAVGISNAEYLTFSVRGSTDLVTQLRDPSGALVTVPVQSSIASDGSVVSTYVVPNKKSSGVWTLSVSNTGSSAASYEVEIPESSALSITDNAGQYFGMAQDITISITVEESSPSLAVHAISGASVEATISSPSGVVTVIQLQEDTSLGDGTYTGVLEGATESGTYTVEYHIVGRNADGTQFEQTTTSQFVVTPSPGGTSVSQWIKKFDINRGDDLQLIGY